MNANTYVNMYDFNSLELCQLDFQNIYEILTAEKSYLKSLDLVIRHFMEFGDLSKILNEAETDQLFCNIRNIRDNSRRYVKLGSLL